jgi:hypothetical protein
MPSTRSDPATARKVATPAQPKSKIQQESSRCPEPGVQSTLGVRKPTRRPQKETPVQQQTQYVGIDLHRRRSVIVRRSEAGQTLETVRTDNDPIGL